MARFKLLIGLANPGPQYVNNRHNIGAIVLDAMTDLEWKTKPGLYRYVYRKDCLFVVPLTGLNDSGRIFQDSLIKSYNHDDILVLHDDMELAFNKVKIAKGISAKGHNGIRSIHQAIGTEYWRLHIGIGRPAEGVPVIKHVLGDLTKEDKDALVANAILRYNTFSI